MTAVALLFAIYMVRPSPFCILDEMDAPLDESNINRFIRVLDRFVSQSQFIIITHNKRTIAKADILYGVTMEERGVSKLVGMKLAAEQRQRRRADGAGLERQRQWHEGSSTRAAPGAIRASRAKPRTASRSRGAGGSCSRSAVWRFCEAPERCTVVQDEPRFTEASTIRQLAKNTLRRFRLNG